ncbi:MAG TPA: hypothetical protein VJL58_09275, partial [Pyrinomonadaceae bacterium]|nr:hypothetical protein [Pyrinomonadaceae bacterium]
MRLTVSLILVFIAISTSAQSRRVIPGGLPSSQASLADRTVKDMFDEANGYFEAKKVEFEKNKVPYSDRLRLQTEREQRALAAKYATIVSARKGLSSDELYYLGL